MDKQEFTKIVVEVSNLVEQRAYDLGKLGSGQSMYTFCVMPNGKIGIDEGSTAEQTVEEFLDGDTLRWFIDRDIDLTMNVIHNMWLIRGTEYVYESPYKFYEDFFVECHHALTGQI